MISNENVSKEDLREFVYTKDVTTLLQDGLEKVVQGITSFEEIYKLIEIDDELDEIYNDDFIKDDNIETLENANNNINNNDNIIEDNVDLSQTEVLDLETIQNG